MLFFTGLPMPALFMKRSPHHQTMRTNHIYLKIPLKKLLKKALLQENRLEKFFTKNKKTPFMKTTKTDPSLLKKEKSTKIRIGTSKNTHEFEGSLFPRSKLEISKEHARGNIS